MTNSDQLGLSVSREDVETLREWASYLTPEHDVDALVKVVAKLEQAITDIGVLRQQLSEANYAFKQLDEGCNLPAQIAFSDEKDRADRLEQQLVAIQQQDAALVQTFKDKAHQLTNSAKLIEGRTDYWAGKSDEMLRAAATYQECADALAVARR